MGKEVGGVRWGWRWRCEVGGRWWGRWWVGGDIGVEVEARNVNIEVLDGV